VDLIPCEVLEGEVRQRLAAPQRERLIEQWRGVGCCAVLQRAPPVAGKPLEARRIDGDRVAAEGIARRLCDENALRRIRLPILCERATQVRDVALNRLSAVSGARSPQSASTIRSVETTSPRWSTSRTSRACSRPAGSRISRPS
jgi:hypothetical protein